MKILMPSLMLTTMKLSYEKLTVTQISFPRTKCQIYTLTVFYGLFFETWLNSINVPFTSLKTPTRFRLKKKRIFRDHFKEAVLRSE